ncbi:MAG TPA: thymidine phosphorylase [Burkholderiaceae bacterium]|nr:thymidine phosphorylase [Burkholderiaceae bacterium]
MSMLAQEVIRIKRDGKALDPAHIAEFVRGLTNGAWSEGQAAAMAMAIFQRGMSRAECVALTLAMKSSGEVLHWDAAELGGPVLDKHSTGGVGDKVSLMLGPIVAACGGYVPMISGRGLGHTGGTLDKFDSIPGYQTAPSVDRLRAVVRAAGCAIVGQTAELAPADRRLYAIRDVTATVESIPLITASILSKKLAAGLHGLAMDVKVGNGAFAATPEMARELAEALVQVANGAGLPTRAWITDMNQVLGQSVGNALEMAEAVDFLTGRAREPRLLEVTRALCAEMLLLGRLATDRDAALAKVDAALASGAAVQRFAQMVSALGGPSDFVEHAARHLAPAPVQRVATAPRAGWITGMATRDIGLLIIELGGGRRKASDAIDHRVGLSELAAVGTQVAAGDPIAIVHAADEAAALAAGARLVQLVHIGDAPPARLPVLVEQIGQDPKGST